MGLAPSQAEHEAAAYITPKGPPLTWGAAMVPGLGVHREQGRGCGGPQVLPPPLDVQTGDAPHPPQTCAGSNHGMGPTTVPGATRRGMGINRKRPCPGGGHRPARNVPVATGLFVWSESSRLLPGGARNNTAGNSP